MPFKPWPKTPVAPEPKTPLPARLVPRMPSHGGKQLVSVLITLRTKEEDDPVSVRGTATPSGDPVAPVPVSVPSCVTDVTPPLAKSTIEIVAYGRFPLTEVVKRDEKLILPGPICVLAVNVTSRLIVFP